MTNFLTTKFMTSHEAYLAMYAFLDAYYLKGTFKEIASLRSALTLLADGRPTNFAIEGDWETAVTAVLNRS